MAKSTRHGDVTLPAAQRCVWVLNKMAYRASTLPRCVTTACFVKFVIKRTERYSCRATTRMRSSLEGVERQTSYAASRLCDSLEGVERQTSHAASRLCDSLGGVQSVKTAALSQDNLSSFDGRREGQRPSGALKRFVRVSSSTGDRCKTVERKVDRHKILRATQMLE